MMFLLSMQIHNPFLKATKLFATKISGTPAVCFGSVKGFEDEKNSASATCSFIGKESRPETQLVTQTLLFPVKSHLYQHKGRSQQNPGSLIKKRGKSIYLSSSSHFLKIFSGALLAEGCSKALLCVYY